MLDKIMNNARGMVVTDLDGTLLQTRRKVSNADIDTLEKLQQRGIIRVVATGRSFYSVSSVLKSGFPIDYLIFSSGAGIILWPTKKIISKHGMGAGDVRFAVNILIDLCIDFRNAVDNIRRKFGACVTVRKLDQTGILDSRARLTNRIYVQHPLYKSNIRCQPLCLGNFFGSYETRI